MPGSQPTVASTRMNIESARPMVEEAKDGQMKTENSKNYISTITANDDLELDPVDLAEIDNPQYVAIYAKEIFDYLRGEEVFLNVLNF